MSVSIRARLTVWYAAVMAIALSILGAGVLVLHTRWALTQVDADLSDLGSATSRVMQEELGESGSLPRAAAEVGSSVDVPDRAIAILEPAGDVLAGVWRGFEYDAKVLERLTSVGQFATVVQRGRTWRVMTRLQTSNSGDYVVLVAAGLDQVHQQHALLVRAVLLATPFTVLLSAAVCWWVASAALRPVTAMAAEAEALTVTSADWRLRTPSTTDELGQLAGAFNRLLLRLGASSATQRQFMADASHELRTPVSVIQTTTEVTLDRQEREAWEYREALTIVNEQSMRLARMVDDMLLLARTDASGLHVHLQPLCLDDVAADCVRAISAVASGKQIAIHTELEAEVTVDGDAGLLRQLATDLLANAIQYTPVGGSVTVDVSSNSTTQMATMGVSDTGPGIPAADRERIFERFVRLDPARATTSGAGLGLPIARWIAEQHDGTLTAEARAAGGSRFLLRLPLHGGASAALDTPRPR